uniref:translation initiation factor IF-2-like n=1 Tax=Halichoerus grypus TaxID=9711 RepID=UPI001659AA80|nr:translation initiation factor IF-2-like [Halichoerus grypus]
MCRGACLRSARGGQGPGLGSRTAERRLGVGLVLGKRTGCGPASAGASLILRPAPPPLRSALSRTGSEAPSPEPSPGALAVELARPRSRGPVARAARHFARAASGAGPRLHDDGGRDVGGSRELGGRGRLRLPQPHEDGAGGGGPRGRAERRDPAVCPGCVCAGVPRSPPAAAAAPWTEDRRVGRPRSVPGNVLLRPCRAGLQPFPSCGPAARHPQHMNVSAHRLLASKVSAPDGVQGAFFRYIP